MEGKAEFISAHRYMSIKVNTLIKFYILVLLYEGPRHGYDLLKNLEKVLETNIGSSQVYPFLHKLRDEGLLEITEVGTRDKRVYKLTKEGHRFVKELLTKSLNIIRAAVKAVGPQACPDEYLSKKKLRPSSA